MLISVTHWIILVCAMIVALPVAILLFETTAVIALPSRSTTSAFGKKFHGRVTVLIPAHNEEDGLPATIANVQPQLRYGDRILVVADNCSDNTARVAKELGAEVIVRLDPVNKGKGFALDFGVRHLSGNPPAIVIVLDADCTLEELAIDSLAATCNATNRPAQARYVMVASPDPSPSSRLRHCVGQRLLCRQGIAAASIPSHDGDLRLAAQPRLGGHGFSIRQQRDRFSALEITDRRSITMVATLGPVIDPMVTGGAKLGLPCLRTARNRVLLLTALVHNPRSGGSGGPPGGFRRAFERRACRERSCG